MKAVFLLACLAVIVAAATAQSVACTHTSDCSYLGDCSGHLTDFEFNCGYGLCHCHSVQTCLAHSECHVHCRAHQVATCEHHHCHCDFHH